MKLFIVGGARPNFVKIAALMHAFRAFKKKHPRSGVRCRFIHTGQHYHHAMARDLFEDLSIPKPYRNLNVGSAPHGLQTARIMSRFEKLLFEEPPDLIVVVGDVNSTLACSLVAAKMGIPIAHVEAGLRSYDRTMPEEINRRLTDALSDFLFTTCADANQNLIREGIDRRKIFFVGNVMVDTLLAHLSRASRSDVTGRLHLERGLYAVLTLHRSNNVDYEPDFQEILTAVRVIQKRTKVVFPVHPRTAARLKNKILKIKVAALKNLLLIPPLGYLDFICLMKNSALVLTDSGGVQEETTVMGVPCLTLRDNTERPVTVLHGTNQLIGRKSGPIIKSALKILSQPGRRHKYRPPLWDGKAAERIAAVLASEGFLRRRG